MAGEKKIWKKRMKICARAAARQGKDAKVAGEIAVAVRIPFGLIALARIADASTNAESIMSASVTTA